MISIANGSNFGEKDTTADRRKRKGKKNDEGKAKKISHHIISSCQWFIPQMV